MLLVAPRWGGLRAGHREPPSCQNQDGGRERSCAMPAPSTAKSSPRADAGAIPLADALAPRPEQIPAVHPVAALFPLLPPDELAALAADIRAHGLLHAVVLGADGQVIDGRNRLAACKL